MLWRRAPLSHNGFHRYRAYSHSGQENFLVREGNSYLLFALHPGCPALPHSISPGDSGRIYPLFALRSGSPTRRHRGQQGSIEETSKEDVLFQHITK